MAGNISQAKVNLYMYNLYKTKISSISSILHYSPDYHFRIYKYYCGKFDCCPEVMMAINNVIKPPMFTAEAKTDSKSHPGSQEWGARAGRVQHLPCNEILLGDQVC